MKFFNNTFLISLFLFSFVPVHADDSKSVNLWNWATSVGSSSLSALSNLSIKTKFAASSGLVLLMGGGYFGFRKPEEPDDSLDSFMDDLRKGGLKESNFFGYAGSSEVYKNSKKEEQKIKNELRDIKLAVRRYKHENSLENLLQISKEISKKVINAEKVSKTGRFGALEEWKAIYSEALCFSDCLLEKRGLRQREAEIEAQKKEIEAQRRAAEVQKQREAEIEAQRRAAEAQKQREAKIEAQIQAQKRAEKKARLEERKARVKARTEARAKAQKEAQRKAAEAQKQREAEIEAQRRAAEAQKKREAEIEAQRRAAEVQKQREAEIEEQRRAAKAQQWQWQAQAEFSEDIEDQSEWKAQQEAQKRQEANTERLRLRSEKRKKRLLDQQSEEFKAKIEQERIGRYMYPEVLAQKKKEEIKVLNAFAVLGFKSPVTFSQVKKRCNKLALKYHPDKTSKLSAEIRAECTEKFKKIKPANEFLKSFLAKDKDKLYVYKFISPEEQQVALSAISV